MPCKIQTTATFDRGMKDALKRETHGVPEYEAISEVVNKGIDLPPGRNVEKLYNRKHGPVYSIRVNEGFRMTFQIIGAYVRFRAVGNHDDAYSKDAGQP
jgi:plasmid maintenance system killer protein